MAAERDNDCLNHQWSNKGNSIGWPSNTQGRGWSYKCNEIKQTLGEM